MNFEDYRRHDAIGLARLIADRAVSAEEVLGAALARAEAVNPTINAIVHSQFDAARAFIANGVSESGPLWGVPYLIKDLGTFQMGQPATFGSRLFADYVADHDSAYVRRCKEAGLVIMGRSNSPEFGLSANTEPKLHGSCRNPWNTEHSAGGSSGGAAAAVAAGILPMAHATDGGGSIRIPAAQCGLFGLKPTRGRVSFAPDVGEGWGGMSIGHVNSRSVRDSALMLDLTSGPEPGDPYTAPPPERSFLSEVGRPPGRLRIARMAKTHRGTDFHADNQRAIQAAAKLCEDLGHIVEEAQPDIDLVALRKITATIAQVNTARAVQARWIKLGEAPSPDKVERVIWAAYERGCQVNAVAYVDAITAIHAAGRALARFMTDYDIILSATVTAPPPKLGTLDMDGDPDDFFSKGAEYVSVTPVANAAGTPAMSVPLYWNDAGLPIGVHFAARFGEEATLIRLAAQLEEAQPWFDRVPSL
jgi:amidase